jgi:antirestriction protein ArdC
MKFYGTAQQTAEKIVDAFKSGNLPRAIAPVFINRKDQSPCRSWSWSNQLLTALAGHSDARGFRQWEEVGRHVKKGEKAFHILAPITKAIVDRDEDGDERKRVIVCGFKSAAVFGLDQTDGEPLPVDTETANWLDGLPLVEVAHRWGLTVDAYNGHAGKALGSYRPGAAIALGVKNLSTWAHEMVHAADDRLGHLKETGQHWRSETVAELGGAILLEVLGYETDSDRGGCWAYVKAYADREGISPITACERVLNRACQAVAMILETAEAIKQGAEETEGEEIGVEAVAA